MSILDTITDKTYWEAFLSDKQQLQHLSRQEEQEIITFINNKRYLHYDGLIKSAMFPSTLPRKLTINKTGTRKKRIVYSFEKEDNIILKFIAHQLYVYNDVLSPNCYAFRRFYGIRNAMVHFKNNTSFSKKYCYKADIHNYFNSIDIDELLSSLSFLKERDEALYNLFFHILKEDRVTVNGKVCIDHHGAMAGTPISPFFANIYLKKVDDYFAEKQIPYFRYSDDILFFADTKEELESYIAIFEEHLLKLKLQINPDKVAITSPGEPWSFLGFTYYNGAIDLSDVTKRKIKAKIKRKANALRLWQMRKNLSPDKAAIGFINAMNRKFYGSGGEDEFTWNRWFFPHLTVSTGLHEIDLYMQEYIRYTITGRHYKGNYRISYDELKAWGYKSLVNEYFKESQNISPYDTFHKR